MENLRWPMCLKLRKGCRFLETTIRLTVTGWATITNSLDEIILFEKREKNTRRDEHTHMYTHTRNNHTRNRLDY